MDATFVETLDLNLFIANFVVGVLLPALVALVTKQVASGTVKSLLLVALSAASAAVTTALIAPDGFSWNVALLSFVQLFYSAVGAYYGLLKPANIAGAGGKIQTAIPGGIG